MNIDNKVILISGVGKGIGKDLFLKCIDHAKFVIGIVRDKKDFKSLIRLLKNKKNYKLFLGDIKNRKIIKNVLYFCNQNNVLINSLINNSGERQRENFLKLNPISIRNIFENNFFSHFFIIQQLINNYLKKRGNNFTIVNIGSIVGVNGFSELSGYASTKSALEALTKCLAVEFASKNVRANIVHPGFIKTSYYRKFKNEKKKLYKWTLSRIPQKKWGEPSDITNLTLFLISDQSKYINGQSFICDGGWLSS